MQCPHCKGEGGTDAFINRGPDIRTHSFGWVTCATCDGAGTISGAAAQRVERGELLRKARVLRRESLMEASRRLGISPADLSAVEHGRPSAAADAALAKLTN